jgi:ATP-dependent helicase IRC3
MIPKIPNPTPRATKTLVLAHRSELLVQAVEQINRHAPHLVLSEKLIFLLRGLHVFFAS